MSARVLSLLSVIIAAAALLALVFWLPGYLQPPTGNVTLAGEPGCSINQGACRATGEQRALTLEIAPAPVRSATPLQISVRLDGFEADAVQLSLEGKDMYMGINQVALRKDSTTGLWLGVGELAVCTTGEMAWRARVAAQQGQQTFEAAFDFNAR